MATDLTRIGQKARKEPDLVFTSLYHHIYDVDNLRACYDTLEADKATGVDGVSKEEYGENLEANLRDLSDRLKRMGYRPGPRRRSYIPKPGSAKGRPLGISNFEDKIVEQATKRTLEPIYEAVFEDSSYGYRPGRNQHQCLDALGRTIQQKKVNQVVEADVKSFFDSVNHEWMVKFLRHRIGDERVIRLIIRMLKSSIMEGGLVRAVEAGTPQGSMISPLLSNIYLHYVLDLWFSKRASRQSRGEAYYFRFADDFLACFQYKSDAEDFQRRLEDRLEGFGLELAKEKTRCIEFGRYARENAYNRGEKPKEFTFLGFTHYCGKTQAGYFKIKRRTSRKKLGQSLRKFTDWVKRARHVLRKGEMLRQARARVIGHLSYYAITDNTVRCSYYVYRTKHILFKWVNRKSQRKAYTWKSFIQALVWVKWPQPIIRKDLNPCRGAEAH
ncbi:group II intron reverse transcriptase/maturase [Desulfobacteraceae bacterium SEEP-SAG9]|nr:group II intron reverse transcriptase/maturase [Desulfobacteraceae bacterium SEEP-SAG9]